MHYIEIDVKTIRETEQAVLFNDRDNEFWVPQSVMKDWPDIDKSGVALIAEWFALKEGLI